jgi:endonuclease/exonuclease/phosphatase family metal-dependent hydrolase
MRTTHAATFCAGLAFGFLLSVAPTQGAILRLATYNLENYLDSPISGRTSKSPEAKAQVHECLLRLHPDVVALQELGRETALLELQASLKQQGLDLPHWQLVSAADTNIHLGVLSKFRFQASHPHTNESFLLNGRRFHLSRGFAEIDFVLESGYRFSVIAAHLKSKRSAAAADEAEIRLEEAKLLREAIDARLTAEPQMRLVVLGDFNDTKESDPVKAIVGRGKTKLVDTRPGEWDPTSATARPRLGKNGRPITWTHYYNGEDSYRRIDYILISRSMAREWVPEQTYVLAFSEWGRASDHRAVVAAFEMPDY